MIKCETLKEAGLTFIAGHNDSKELVVWDDSTERYELYFYKPDCCSYHIIFDDKKWEFVRSSKTLKELGADLS